MTMEIELFKKSYTPTMMRLIKKFDDLESKRLAQVILGNDYTKFQTVSHNIEDLRTAKMLLSTYPGCAHCFEIDCTSDHK